MFVKICSSLIGTGIDMPNYLEQDTELFFAREGGRCIHYEK